VPELPEVETFVRGLRPLVGATIRRVEVLDPRLELSSRAVTGSVIEAVERRGKYIVFHLSGGRMLIFHLRMSGRLARTCPDNEMRFVRLIVQLDRGEIYFINPRRLGTVCLSNDGFPYRLGIDPFDDEFSPDCLNRIVTASRMPIKSILIDQRRLAGLGNIYAAEVLWHARIDPRRPGAALNEDEVARLHEAIVDVLTRAIEHMGTTTGDTVLDYRDAGGRQGGFQAYLAVYGRQGEACPRCSEAVERIVQGGRSTYLCSRCQR